MMIGALDTVDFFENLTDRITKEEAETFEKAMNRLRYMAAKDVGVEKKVTRAVKAWHSDFYRCGNCGAGAQAAAKYCYNCGTYYLDNDYSKRRTEKWEKNHQMTIAELIREGEEEDGR